MSGKVTLQMFVVLAVVGCVIALWGGAVLAAEEGSDAGGERAADVMEIAGKEVEFVMFEPVYEWRIEPFERGPVDPGYAAKVMMRTDRDISRNVESIDLVNGILSTEAAEGFSSEQRDFLKYTSAPRCLQRLYARYGAQTWVVFGVSEKDTKLMVKAFAQFARDYGEQFIEEKRQRMEELQGKIAELKDKREKNEKLIEEYRERLEKVKESTIYTSALEAREAATRLTSRMEELKLAIAALGPKAEVYAGTPKELEFKAELKAAENEFEVVKKMRDEAKDLSELPGKIDALSLSVEGIVTRSMPNRPRGRTPNRRTPVRRPPASNTRGLTTFRGTELEGLRHDLEEVEEWLSEPHISLVRSEIYDAVSIQPVEVVETDRRDTPWTPARRR
ncbi:hypothetical protein STSP2_01003 [Anaerohalosphaera lusitana]|uniref:Uncharacterized protein n=1 Tax=Anaerohalosphaera lusitana TaxID=1936003 RepID=A0A1U9NIV5_9BACT|nr:hypothetical protein [Anaerohalosphaera lusitana]AQT67851.1 hypothetical protein STSP2_01003 [Anaerohalosphaera lusitana]